MIFNSERNEKMAGSLNKVQLIGHLGRDPEQRSFPNGDAVCSFSMATSESWKDKQTGERKERTEWHSVQAHRGLAEVIGQYLRKGSKVYIEGALRTRKWQDKDGADRYTTEIIADQMIMLDGKPQGDDGGPQRQERPAARQPAGGNAQRPAPQQKAAQGFDDMDDDIPF